MMDGRLVATPSGAVRGIHSGRGAAFLGLPYAAPPTGSRRFRPPDEPSPWSGVLDASRLPAACPQPRMPRLFGNLDPGADRFQERYDEDCLTVNVWTPAPDGARRPVMVWLHGGWFAIGSGNEPAYRGERLSARGDVVVVTVNHRLGALGFLALDADAAAGSGNAGLLDMVAALRWVAENIEHFGGDPDNVTIFGESGGACKVCALLATPAAVGLFHRAIVQSGPLLRAVEPERAARSASALLARLEVSTLDELQRLPVDAIVEAQSAVVGGALGDAYGDGPRFAPVRDGAILPAHPFEPAATPFGADVPLLIGSCRDESSMLLVTTPGLDGLAPAEQAGRLNELVFRGAFDHVVDGYRGTRPVATPAERLVAAATDQIRVGSVHLAERWVAGRSAPAFMYRLDFASGALGGRLGALHAYDVGFVFGNTDCAAGVTSLNRGLYADRPGVDQLTDAMADAWIAFARDGEPGHAGLPEWPPYEPARRTTMIFDVAPRAVDDPDGEERRLWHGLDSGM